LFSLNYYQNKWRQYITVICSKTILYNGRTFSVAVRIYGYMPLIAADEKLQKYYNTCNL